MLVLKIMAGVGLFFMVTFYLVLIVACGVSVGLKTFFKNKRG